MLADVDVENHYKPTCGFHLTRGKWDPYPWLSSVDDGSVAASSGIKPGDCLLEVNGEDILGQRISEIAEIVKTNPQRVSLLLWNAGVDPQCTPEMHSIYERMRKNPDQKKIHKIFKQKRKKTQVPDIKITQSNTNKFLAKIIGKSSSVDNLSIDNKFLSPTNAFQQEPAFDSLNLKRKSLSSNELFHSISPSVSRSSSVLRLNRNKSENNSTIEPNCLEQRPASCHGSFEFLGKKKKQRVLQFPREVKFSIIFKKITAIVDHWYNISPPNFKFSLSKIEEDGDISYVISLKGDTYFLKVYSYKTEDDDSQMRLKDTLIWAWYFGDRKSSKNCEIQVEIRNIDIADPLLRLRESRSLPTCRLQEKFVCEISVNCQLNVLTFDLFANVTTESI
ncbi:hypothetical protein NQ317_017517 [Molorchus minor]|uniref:PDZ domain-containing protein n=1 Tax=Molorchus minor TaxID=1323400 RepID=A0ABQ9JNQ4_9CUCU|nr:hypothetical protein NQ317_017517 [Molorchus minor]